MRHLSGLETVAGAYDGFIVDLWGVVHDGTHPCPGALDCLIRLRASGAPVLLLSNAPRRARAVASSLAAMEIGLEAYTHLLTSGEETWRALGDMPGLAIYHLGPERDRSLIEGLDLRLVTEPGRAAMLLNTGPDDRRDPTSLTPFLPELGACLAAGLPMLCANPDFEVLRGATRVICAGALAVWYEQQGGHVRWIGKPFADIYATSLALVGRPADHVLAIGDSLRTDIARAAAASIDACWVLGGIHALTDPSTAERTATNAGLSPRFSIPTLRWSATAQA